MNPSFCENCRYYRPQSAGAFIFDYCIYRNKVEIQTLKTCPRDVIERQINRADW